MISKLLLLVLAVVIISEFCASQDTGATQKTRGKGKNGGKNNKGQGGVDKKDGKGGGKGGKKNGGKGAKDGGKGGGKNAKGAGKQGGQKKAGGKGGKGGQCGAVVPDNNANAVIPNSNVPEIKPDTIAVPEQQVAPGAGAVHFPAQIAPADGVRTPEEVASADIVHSEIAQEPPHEGDKPEHPSPVADPAVHDDVPDPRPLPPQEIATENLSDKESKDKDKEKHNSVARK